MFIVQCLVLRLGFRLQVSESQVLRLEVWHLAEHGGQEALVQLCLEPDLVYG